jgi:hypothetical protein
MTFERATELTYPKIAPPNSVNSWCYSTNIPTSAAGTIIIPGDIIPNSIDLLPIFRDMEDAFGEGMRSVVLTMTKADLESGSKNTYVSEYHFAKVRQRHIIVEQAFPIGRDKTSSSPLQRRGLSPALH